MSAFVQVNYDENTAFAKRFHAEGEDLVQLHSATRLRLQALRKDWQGEAADNFFEEMESELLPALKRVAEASFLSEEVLVKIMKLVRQADEEVAGYFKNDLGADFGASLFGAALGGLGVPGGAGGDDFGAGKFGEAVAGDGSVAPAPAGGGGAAGAAAGATGDAPQASEQAPEMQETPPAAETAGAGGGGGGGGSSGQGLQGDLRGLGTGVGGDTPQTTGAAGGRGGMPDHVFNAAAGAAAGGGPAQGGAAGAAGGAGSASGGGAAGAAAAGAAGAAALGGAAKAAQAAQDGENQSGE